jgi:hypothetical protein
MSYPGNLGGLRIVPLGRAIDRIQTGGDFFINQDVLLASPVIFQVSETVRGVLEQRGLNQLSSPRRAMAADLIYENAYLASVARGQAGNPESSLDAAFVNNIIGFTASIWDGLWPF